MLQQTARDNAKYLPKAAETVFKNFYMNDLSKSEREQGAAVQLQSDLTEMLSRGGFHLTKWSSNSREVLRRIPEQELASSLKGLEHDGDLPIERALGAAWNTETGSFVSLYRKSRR